MQVEVVFLVLHAILRVLLINRDKNGRRRHASSGDGKTADLFTICPTQKKASQSMWTRLMAMTKCHVFQFVVHRYALFFKRGNRLIPIGFLDLSTKCGGERRARSQLVGFDPAAVDDMWPSFNP
ncbi:hypothetical protein [Ensifer sp. 4252]|uniref:hypothetical protein n=1 Tax=Ensifer sp. 4252 TaxID=3373915 RepID=UPI003D1EA282